CFQLSQICQIKYPGSLTSSGLFDLNDGYNITTLPTLNSSRTMSSKIYTKTGDKGTTSLIGGTKVAKSDLRIEAYGTVDELNSYIGLCKDLLNGVVKNVLPEIQDRLFTIGSSLACDPEKEPKMRIPDLQEADIELLEKEIDKMTAKVPPM